MTITNLERVFDQGPSLELLEVIMSMQFLPKSQEKQSIFIKSITDQPIQYLCRNLNQICTVFIKNFDIVHPQTISHFFKMLQRQQQNIVQYMSLYNQDNQQLQNLIAFMLLSKDTAEQVMGCSILNILYSNLNISFSLKVSLFLYLIQNEDQIQYINEKLVEQAMSLNMFNKDVNFISNEEMKLRLLIDQQD